MFEEEIKEGIHKIFNKLTLDPAMLYFFENIGVSNLKDMQTDGVLSIIAEQELDVLGPASGDGVVYDLRPVFETGYMLIDQESNTEGFFAKDDYYYIFQSDAESILVASIDKDRFEEHCKKIGDFTNPTDIIIESDFAADKVWNLNRQSQYFDVDLEAMVKYICGGDVKQKLKIMC